MRRRLVLAAGVAVLLSGRAAVAQICTASTSGLSFSAYDPFASSPSSITGTVSVNCQAILALSVGYSIQLGGGTGGTIASRAMVAGLNKLGYQLYTNAAHSVIWGDGTGGSGVVSDGYGLLALGSITRTYTAYGLVPARQMVAPGVYLDTVTVLISY